VKKTQELQITNRNDWRRGLKTNHRIYKEVWLVFYKRHTGKPSMSYDDAVEEALCFGWIDSIVKKINDEKFARKFTPRKPSSKWSELNKRRAEKMIAEGRMAEAGLALVNQAKDSGEWLKKQQIENNLVLPEYIKNALKSNGKARSNFNTLAPSYKKQYVRWVDSAKKEETRKRRLAELVEVLEKNEKLGLK